MKDELHPSSFILSLCARVIEGDTIATMKRLAPLLLLLLIVNPVRLSAMPAQLPATILPSAFFPIYQTGMGWAEEEYTTAIGFGDVDGDGRDEALIGRYGTTGPRLLLIDDASADYALLWTFGEGWGAAAWPTAVALGDVDGDGRDEIAVARFTAVNERVYVFDDAAAGFATLIQLGKEWPSSVHAVDVALGDVDGDGRAELGVAINALEGPRVYLYEDVSSDFAPLWSTGETWGAAATATAVAFGDADGDGVDEIAIARNHDSNARYFVHDGAPDFELLLQSGETWGPGSYATDVAFGNVDDDPAEELGVARMASLNERAILLDDAAAGFATLHLFGQTWAFNAYVTGIAFGDVDGDGRDEIGLARVATINERFAVFDDTTPDGNRRPFAELWGGGDEWSGEQYATAIAFGQADASTAEAELAVGRFAAAEARYFILERGWTSWVPIVSEGREMIEEPEAIRE